MPAIPTTIDDVTAIYLAEVTGLPITSAKAEQIGAGIGVIGAVYRVQLERGGCPSSVVVKLPGLDEAAVFTGSILRMYIREVRFYEGIARPRPSALHLLHRARRGDECVRRRDRGHGIAPDRRPGRRHGARGR